MSKKKKTVIVIVIIVLVALLSVGTMAMIRYIDSLRKENNQAGLKTQSNVILDENAEPDLREKVSSVNVNIRKNIVIEKNDNGKYTMKLGLNNGNEHQYMFTITVDDKEIYRSDLIPAGASLPEVELDNINLESGSYEAVVIFSVINEKDNQSVMGSTGVQLTLDVTK